MNKKAITPEVVYDVETWKADNFTTQLIDIKAPPASLDLSGSILYWHTMTMETGKASIAAALMTAIGLHKARLDHPREFVSWCEANLRHGNIKLSMATAYRYLALLEKTVGRNVSIDELVKDSEQNKLEAVATFTKYTNYQSLYQIYHGETLVKASNIGGAGRGQGRKRKEITEAESAAAAADAPEFAVEGANNAMLEFYQHGVIENGFLSMSLDNLKRVESMLTDVLSKVKSALKVKQDK